MLTSLHAHQPLAPPLHLLALAPRTAHLIATVNAPRGDDDPDDEDDEVFLSALDSSLRDVRDAAAGRPPRPEARRDSGLGVGSEREGGLASEDGRGQFQPSKLARTTLDELKDSFDAYTERPSQQFVLGALAMLFGFYVSHGQLTGGGDQGGRWEYASAGVATFVVERITRGYWAVPMESRTPTLKLLQAFRVGYMYGIVLDALKLAG
jgi:hypothetical protein